MKESYFKITKNVPLTDSVYLMNLEGDTSDITAPGQFVNIKLDGLFLRRPISVCDAEGNVLTIIYKVVGKGTEQMSTMQNETLNVLTGLGNGYNTDVSGDTPVLLGGGVGVLGPGGNRDSDTDGRNLVRFAGFQLVQSFVGLCGKVFELRHCNVFFVSQLGFTS